MEDQKQIKASYMFSLQFCSQSLLGYINTENVALTFAPAEQCFVCS